MNALIYKLFMSLIEIHLLKVRLIAHSKYERGNGANKTRTISSFESGIWFLEFQRNKEFIYWSSFLKLV